MSNSTSDSQIEKQMVSNLSKLMSDEDGDDIDELIKEQKINDSLRFQRQRSILDDFVNGFVPEEIFAQDLKDMLDEEKQKRQQRSNNNGEEDKGQDDSQLSKGDKVNQSPNKKSNQGQQSKECDDLQSEIDLLGSLDVDQLDNILSIADNMAIKLAYETTIKMKNLKNKMTTQLKSEQDKVKIQFLKRKRILERYMKGATFVRLIDKLSFLLGVVLLISTTYILGRYPNDLFYKYHCSAIIALVVLRFYNYKIKGWHYYLFDFCYFANVIIIYFLQFDPKNDILFKVFFIYANGPFGLAIPAFKNSMIFHKLDNLISCAIHIIPMVSSWNLRWHTLTHEQSLDLDKRYFVSLNPDDLTNFSDQFWKLFMIPLVLYLFWALLYSLKVFVISSKRIQERNYETMYIYYMNQAGPRKILQTFGMRLAPVFFMSLHVLFFIVSSVFAILSYHYFYCHCFFMTMWVCMSIWNGANFYMEYFSKKYEANLKKLEEIEVQLTERA